MVEESAERGDSAILSWQNEKRDKGLFYFFEELLKWKLIIFVKFARKILIMRKKVYTSPVTEPQRVCCTHVLMLSGITGGGTIGGGGNASEGGNPPLDTRRQSVWEMGNSAGWEEDW